MTLTIGRTSGLRPASGYPKIDGDKVTIQGYVLATNMDVQRGTRQQLLGLVNNEDEEVVPCIWASDPTFDGFYRPVSMAVEQLGVTRGRNMRFAATLQRLRDYAAPMFEVSAQQTLRTNAAAFTGPTSIGGFSFTDQASGAGIYLPSTPFGSGATGGPFSAQTSDLIQVELNTKLYTAAATYTYRYIGQPSVFYGGSCRIEALFGSTWIPMNGRSASGLLPSTWRITNGMIRFTLGATRSANSTLEVWDPVALAWESVLINSTNASNIGIGWGMASSTAPRLEILRNSPEKVVVRTSNRDQQDTFSLQRGERGLTWTFKASDGGTFASGTPLGLKFASVTACTALTGPTATVTGIRNTANDANGNRWLFAAPVAVTNDLVNGKMSLTAASTTPTFLIGAELNGSTSVAPYQADAVVSAWMAPISWRQRVVAP